MSKHSLRRGGIAWLGIAAALITLGACARQDSSPARETSAVAKSDARPAGSGQIKQGSLREVHVALEVDLRAGDPRTALGKLEDIAREGGGFVQGASVGADETRSHLLLRVPPPSVAVVRAACVEVGAITRDEETETDVTDAIADLDARLRAGQTEEARLLALVAERTGSVGDVLAAERALADVRDRIERLDAESRASHARVALATVDIWLVHPGRAPAKDSLVTELSTAAKDGVRGAGEVALGIATITLRAGPSAAIAALLLGAAMAGVRRWRGRRVS